MAERENLPSGTWKSRAFAIDYALRYMESRGYSSLPLQRTIVSDGETRLLKAVIRHYGGLKRFRSTIRGARRINRKGKINYWAEYEAWKFHGLINHYDSRNPSSLESSEDPKERSWYKRGEKKKWLTQFDFARKRTLPLWDDFESWKNYGLENQYNLRNFNSLKNSDNREEIKWYNRGRGKGWLGDFSFQSLSEQGSSLLERYVGGKDE